MQESVMWLVNAMIEQTDSPNVIAMCASNNIVQIIADQISMEKKEPVSSLGYNYCF